MSGSPDTPRRFHALDAGMAVVVLGLALLLTEGEQPDSLALRDFSELPLVAYPLFVAACAAILWRRTHPVPVFAVTYVVGVLAGLGGWSDLIGLSFMIALYSIARHSDSDRTTQAALALAILFAGATLVIADDGTFWEGVFGVGVIGGVWYVGRRMRFRSERKAQTERERLALAGRMVAEERARIARELHDVVAHRVSLMTVQAGAAKTVAATDLEGAIAAMGAVEQAGREALDELRHVLDVLRPDPATDGLGPLPGLEGLPRLVSEFAEAGLVVDLSADGVPSDLPSRVDLSAYRIIQEALTNVLKHAGPEPEAEVRLSGSNGRLRIEVLDRGTGTTILPGAGHGIIGMRERAVLLDGTLEAGARPGGGFQVTADLPLEVS